MKNRRCPNHKCCLDYDYGACETCFLGNHILKLHKKIDRLKAKTNWISVDERLPEECACYLVNIINHFGLDFVTFTYYTKGYGWGVPDVTHWMPLPKPPKMKGGAE